MIGEARLIVDTDVCHRIPAGGKDPDAAQVAKWLMSGHDGCMVYGGENARQLELNTKVWDFLTNLNRAGRALKWADARVDAEATAVISMGTRSNDAHVLALARLSGARTLWTADGDLIDDFKDVRLVPPPQGAIFTTAAHVHLLRHVRGCPKWDEIEARR